MKLYHGSNVEITEVDLSKCKPYKDFGKGFYATEIKEQAERMAKRVARIYGGSPFVSEFEFDESALQDSSLNTRIFNKAGKDWAFFVINNRKREAIEADADCNADNRYDIVTGPVADDDLALLFRQFDNGLIDADYLVREMEYKELTSQYSFHTDAALKYLKKAGRSNE